MTAKNVMPKISLVAYLAEGWVFVGVPGELGRYVKTHPCVVDTFCPYCESVAGEPCKRIDPRKKTFGNYIASTHHLRRAEHQMEKRRQKRKVTA